MRKIIALILALALALPISALAGELPPCYTLSLDEAIAMATENNVRLDVCDAKKKSAEISLEDAKITQKDLKDLKVITVSTISYAYAKYGYTTAAFEKAIELAVREKEMVKNSIAYEVTQNYYNYKLALAILDIANDSLALAKDNKAIVDKQFELGMISAIEHENAAVAVMRAQNAVESYSRTALIAKENLAISLVIEGECEFDLTDGIAAEDFVSDAEADSLAALDTRYDTAALRVQRDLAKLKFDITDMYSSSTMAVYQSAYSDYMSAEYTSSNTEKLIRLSIKASYNAILAAKGELESAIGELEIKRLEYNAAKVRFSQGSITNIELTSALNTLSQYEINVENARLTYKLAIEKYKYEISTGI